MKIKQYIVEEINFSCCWKILQGQKLKSLFLIVLELRFSFRAPSSVAIDSSFFMKLTNCFFELIPSLISNRYWMFWQWFYLFYLFSSISYLSSSIFIDLKLLISPSSFKMLLTFELELRMNSFLSYFLSVLSSSMLLGPVKTVWTLGSEA